MPRLDVKTCRYCGRHASEVGPLSWTRTCIHCAHARQDANNEQIRAATGPWYLHQQRRQELAARKRRLAAERAMSATTYSLEPKEN